MTLILVGLMVLRLEHLCEMPVNDEQVKLRVSFKMATPMPAHV